MPPPRKATGPVQLPFTIRASDPTLARWFGEARVCMQQLRDRLVPSGGGRGGSSGAAPVTPPPLTIVSSRPAYIPAPEGEDAEVPTGHKRVWIRRAGCMGIIADNWDDFFDCPLADPEDEEDETPDTWFWAKINLPAGTTLTVSTWEIVTGEAFDAFTNAPWPAGGARPTVFYHALGRVFASGSTVFNTGGGGLLVSEHVTNISNGPKPGVANVTRAVYVQREGY